MSKSDEAIGEPARIQEPPATRIRAEDVKPGDRILPLDDILAEPLDVKKIRVDGGAVIIVGAANTWAGWRTDLVWRFNPHAYDRETEQ